MAATDIIWDYVVVGAGVAGSVLASRLRQYDQSLNILLLEAGSDTRSREDILYANANPVGGDLDWNFKTEPIPGFQNRETVIGQGKGLGGSAAINMGKPRSSGMLQQL
jgi:choline dehydrogenase-like flavoprotein